MDIARESGAEPREPSSRALDRLGPTEAWTGAAICLVAALCFIRFGFGSEALIGSVFGGVLIVLSKIDFETRLVPNRIVLPAIGVILVAQLLAHPDRRVEFLVATVASGLFLLIPLLVYPAGMGLGDVKLAMLLGAGLGAAVLTAFVVSFLAAFFVAVAILVSRGAEGRKIGIPFVPFLALGGLVALLIA